ncbi:MAG: hypothetical protein LM573_07315 [Thermofilum sp.]|nr:hypothetical protein [Thermofilum sp.]
MDLSLVSAGFGAYFLLVVISYMLLSSPDVNWLWGVISLILSWVVIAIVGYYITEENLALIINFISANPGGSSFTLYPYLACPLYNYEAIH